MPAPALVTATTFTSYEVPFVKPVNVQAVSVKDVNCLLAVPEYEPEDLK